MGQHCVAFKKEHSTIQCNFASVEVGGSVRSESGLCPEGANFSRPLESIFNDQICSHYYNVMY